MDIKLTPGVIQKILNDEEVPDAIVQVLGYKQIPGQSLPHRYRLQISDSEVISTMVMLGTQLNDMISSHELEKFTVIKVNKSVCNKVADKKLIMLLSVTVIAPGNRVGKKLGSPSNMTQIAPTAGPSNVSPEKSNNQRQSPIKFGSPYKANLAFGGPHPFVQNEPSVNIHPISTLTPYQNKWTIKARVTSKQPIRHWTNSRGEGRVFSINLLDESGEIKASGFNDAIDKYYDMLEVNKVYYISKGNIKPADKRYNSLKNDYELTFNSDTTIAVCENAAPSIPMLKFDFVRIDQIEQMDKDRIVDVIGVCKTTSDATTIMSRNTNKELIKRDITLVDNSNKDIKLTLWGTDAENFDQSQNPVLAIKGARVTDFFGKSLSLISSSMLQINPDIGEAHLLKGWFDTEGCHKESTSLSASSARTGEGTWKTFSQVETENLGMGDKPDYYNNKATITLVRKENCMYKSCPSGDCKRKVREMNNGNYECDKCGKEYSDFKWRLLLSVSVADPTGSQWVTCFQEIAETILGSTSQELGLLKDTDEDKFNDVISDANFKSFNFTFRTKMETFNEESRLKTHIMSASPIDYVSYGKRLLKEIKSMQ